MRLTNRIRVEGSEQMEERTLLSGHAYGKASGSISVRGAFNTVSGTGDVDVRGAFNKVSGTGDVSIRGAHNKVSGSGDVSIRGAHNRVYSVQSFGGYGHKGHGHCGC